MKVAYRTEIDGMRAIAVIAVIINHFNQNIIPRGYLGVDMFFVISGYVITRSLSSREAGSLAELISSFYSRRIKRLVPALAFFVITTGILFSLFNPNPKASLDLGIRSLFGLANISLFRGASDYFSESALLNPYTHTWSLGVEEQFYIVFPLLYWFFAIKQKNSLLNSGLIALSIPSALLFAFLYSSNFPAAYYLPFTRFWEIAAGCILFLQESEDSRLYRFFSKLPGIFYLGGIAIVFFADSISPVLATVMAVLLTTGLIASTENAGMTRRVLQVSMLEFIGLRSYSAYLWHWTVLVISRWTIGISLWTAPIQLAIILIISALSYQYIESPLRKARLSTTTTLISGIGLLLFTAIPLRVLGSRNPNLIYSGNRSFANSQLDRRPMTGDLRVKNISGVWKGKECSIESNDDTTKSPSIRDCTLGDFYKSQTRVLIVGNSFSAALAESFAEVVRQDQRFSATITSSFGATPAPYLNFKNAWSNTSSFYWSSVVPKLTKELRIGDIVIAVNNLDDFTGSSPRLRLEELRKSISTFSRELQSRGIKLVYLRPIPNMTKANCSPRQATKEWFRPKKNNCKYTTKEATLNEQFALNQMFDKLALSQQISTIDIFEIFCDKDVCTHTAGNGTYLYRDEYGHPSNAAAKAASIKVLQQLRQISGY